MKIAVEGCCHGELDKIYDTVTQLERQNGFKIDVLIICGDFQSVRNTDDLQAMAVPPKYQKLNTFYKYYSGEKVAPVLTIFVGGNHEASNYLQELPYGGWVARNIYYLGYAGIIQVGGVRIGGISGIYKGNDYNKGHYEYPPYDEGSKRSVYHVRNLEVFRLKQVTRPVDIFVSHDWPTGIYNYGDADGLVRIKPFFKKEVEEGTLGSKPCADLLNHLKPSYWFAAHLHVKFAAFVQHMHGDGGEERATKFLALDKCLPRRKFLQVLDVPHQDEEGLKIKLDPEWLRIVQSTNHLLNTTSMNRFMPGPGGNVRFDFTVSDKDMESVSELFGGDMTLPENFVETAPPFTGNPNNPGRHRPNPLSVRVNPQTTLLCTMLEITDPNAKRLGKTSEQLLEESNIGLVTEGGDDDDEPDDGVESDGEMNESSNVTFNPSFIDSSLDLSQSSSTSFSSNISASWDNLMPGDQRRGGNATPSSTVKNVDVADDDEELQSILLAQKSKSLPPTPHHPSSNTDTSPRGSPPVSSSLLLSSTPLHRSSTDPVQSSSSSLLLSPADSGHSTSSQSENASSSVSRSRKLSVADRLRALNAKETQCKNDEKEADSTSSDANTTPSLSRLASVDSSHTPSPRPNLSKSDTLDCQGTQTRTELEALCASSSGVSSTTLGERLSPPLKRDSSGLSTDTVESGGEGSQVTSSSPLLSSSSSSSLPSPSVAGGGSVKKFKRRNVSMYQEESQE